jgi:hypothetical protein
MPGMRSTVTARRCGGRTSAGCLGVDPAPCAVGGGRHGAGLVEARPCAVAVDTRGAGVHQPLHRPPRASACSSACGCRGSPCPAAAPGAAHGRPGRQRPSVAGSSRLPSSGTAPAPAVRRHRRATSQRQHAPARRSRRSTRRPTSPQPTISRWGRAGIGGRGSSAWRSGHNRGAVYVPTARHSLLARPVRPTDTFSSSPPAMTFQSPCSPRAAFAVERDEAMLAAAIRQGIGLPYGCRDGACGSCKSRCWRAA